jgi:two-component system, sensor histidine kinase and response regulator
MKPMSKIDTIFLHKNIKGAVLFFSLYLGIIACLPAQNKVIDSLQQLLDTTRDDAKQILVLQELATQFIYIQPDKTIQIGEQALTLSKLKKDKVNTCISLNTIGYGHWGKGNSLAAFQYYRQSLEMANALGNELLITRNYQSIGNIYNQSGYYQKALTLLADVRPVYERYGEYPLLTFAYNSTAYAFIYLKQYDSATRYLGLALPLAQKYRPLLHPTILFNYADMSFKQKNLVASRQYLDQSLSLALSVHDVRMISRSNQLLAEINLLEGYLDTAFIQAVKAVTAAQQAGIKESAFPSYLTLSRVSEARGDKASALGYLQVYNMLKDSVRDRGVASTINLYEYDQQQSKISILRAEKRQDRIFLYSAIAVLLLVGLFLVYAIRMRGKTERINRLLEAKNNEVAQQARQLKDMNDVKSKLFSIVAHDLRSPLANIIGILRLLEDDSIQSEDIVPHLPALTQNVGETIVMLDNLLQWSRSQLQGVAAKPTPFSINEVILSKIKLYEQEARRKDITLHSLVQQNETVYADKNMIAIVLQNLINNAVKFTGKGGSIWIDTSRTINKAVTVTVSDTGRGINNENIRKLVDGQGFTSEGTSYEKGLGLGFQICKEFVSLNNGKILIKSEENKGTTIQVTLPEASEL